MSRFFSLRQFGLVLVAVVVLALAAPAQAAKRPHHARGTAHFGIANDFVGEGVATHLGAYTELGTAVFTPTADPAVFHVEAKTTYTAANGDQLKADIVGELNGVTGAVTATVTYTGGTGRFLNAVGTATLSGQFAAASIQVVVEGTIDYPRP